MDPVNIPSALPVDVAIFIEAITPLLYLLVLVGIWLGIMIPLLIVLFVASDVTLRRKPIFTFNVISVVIGIIIGLISVISLMKILQGDVEDGASGKLNMAVGVMLLGVEFFVDGILVFRVYSVFPRRTTRKAIWFGILSPIVLLKIARLTNLILVIMNFAKAIEKISLKALLVLAYTLPGAKIAWVLQLVDNAACSVIFIWKLKTAHRACTSSTVVKDSYAARVKALFWIATSNFVFPALFDIVLIVATTSVNIQENAILLWGIHTTDIYIEIIGVLFATVWPANTRANIISSSASSHLTYPNKQYTVCSKPRIGPNRSHSSRVIAMVPVALERAESNPADEMFALQPPKKSVY